MTRDDGGANWLSRHPDVRPMSRHDLRLLALLGPHSARHARDLLHRFPALVLTSTGRSRRRNAAVGGSPTSWHLVGRAADYDGPEALLQEAAAYAREQRIGAKCTGPEEVLVHDAGTGRHLHVAW